jgi:ubiquitin carboxyl-terminal hydrolase 4/11/15
LRQAWKQFFLWRTPPILVIHLKRFQYDGMFRDKLDHLVDFPLEGLDLSQHVLDSRVQQPAIYDLYAVSNHYGGLGGGHYTAFCRNADDGNWYEFDDSYVRQVEPNSVVTEAAYVLFYMRRDLFPQRLRSKSRAAASDAQSPADSIASGEEGWVHIQQPAQNGGAQSAVADALDAPVDVLLEQGERALEEFKANGGEVLDTYSTPTSYYKRNTNPYGSLYSAYL